MACFMDCLELVISIKESIRLNLSSLIILNFIFSRYFINISSRKSYKCRKRKKINVYFEIYFQRRDMFAMFSQYLCDMCTRLWLLYKSIICVPDICTPHTIQSTECSIREIWTLTISLWKIVLSSSKLKNLLLNHSFWFL